VQDPEPLLERIRNAGTVFVRTSAVVGDYAAGATHILPTGGLARGSAGWGSRPFSSRSSSSRCRPLAGARDRAAAGPPRGSPAARGRAGAGVRAQPAPGGLSRLRVVPSSADVASRHGLRAGADPALRPEHAACSRGAAGAAGGELRAAAGVPGRDIRGAAGGCRRLLRRHRRAGRDRRGGGRADLGLRTHVPRTRQLGRDRGAHLRSVPDRDAAGRSVDHRLGRRRRPDLGLQPEQPDRGAARPGRDRRARLCSPVVRGRGRRGLLRVRRRDVCAPDRRAAESDRPPDALEASASRRFELGGRSGRRRRPRSSSCAGRRRASAARRHGSARQRCATRASM
jgi:hypothetical protein